MTTLGTVLVIAKEPVPGRVKTRLCPPCTPDQAAALAAAALADTLAVCAAVPAGHHRLVLDGTPGDWVPAGWEVVAQVEGDLDVRLAAAFATAAADGPAVLVGMDTPQLQAEHLAGFEPDRYDALLGPAADGGFWVAGFARPADAAETIPGVAMSRADTGARQHARLVAAGLRVQPAVELVDVDTASSAAQVAAAAPRTRFAATWRAIAATSPVGAG